MRELPRDLVTILRTEARNQRTPPIDYIIAGDGGRMVVHPDPDIAMAELLEEAATALAAKNSRIAELEAGLEESKGTLDWAARRMKGNCAGSDVSAVMLSAARANALLNGERKG